MCVGVWSQFELWRSSQDLSATGSQARGLHLCAVGLWPCRLVGTLRFQMRGSIKSSHSLVAITPLSIFTNSLLNPGDGKTHYIKQQLANSLASMTVSVNEAFTPLKAISKLKKLPLNQRNCAIFFNFTMLPPGVRKGRYKSIHFLAMIAVVVFKTHVFMHGLNLRLWVHVHE